MKIGSTQQPSAWIDRKIVILLCLMCHHCCTNKHRQLGTPFRCMSVKVVNNISLAIIYRLILIDTLKFPTGAIDVYMKNNRSNLYTLNKLKIYVNTFNQYLLCLTPVIESVLFYVSVRSFSPSRNVTIDVYVLQNVSLWTGKDFYCARSAVTLSEFIWSHLQFL